MKDFVRVVNAEDSLHMVYQHVGTFAFMIEEVSERPLEQVSECV